MKKSEFKDPIRPKVRVTSRDFVAPTKEQATTGEFMRAGDYHGVGFRQPVGKEKASSLKDGPIPQDSKCFPSSQAI